MKHHVLDRSLHLLSRVVGVCLLCFCCLNIYLEIHAEDLLEQAFYPAKTYETVTDLWNTKNAVGNEVFVSSVQSQDSLWYGCFVQGTKISNTELENKIKEQEALWSPLRWKDTFCEEVLGWDWNVPLFTQQEPLIIRITKRLLRITIVLSITMVIYNGVAYIVEAAKWGEVKNATKNILLIVWGMLLSLFSLVIINLLRSISLSSLNLWG